jgi:branched-chain amino acid transport system permease protein
VLVTVALIVLAGAWPELAGSDFLISAAAMALTFLVLGQALNLIYGYAGFLCLAITAFWAIGGYGAARLTVSAGITPALAIGAGGVIAAVVGAAFGLSTLNRGRDAFVILSLVFLLLAGILADDWTSVTGGGQGIVGLPPVPFGGYQIVTTTGFYYATLAVAVLCMLIIFALVSSTWGRTIRATSADELLAASFGVHLLRERVIALTAAAFCCGLIGGVEVFRVTLADPSLTSVSYLAPLLAIVFIGGPGRFAGVTVASVVVMFLPEFARDFDSERDLVYGAVLLVICLAFPDGLPAALGAACRQVRRRVRAEPPAAPGVTSGEPEVAGRLS